MYEEVLHTIEEKGLEFKQAEVSEMMINFSLKEDIILIVRNTSGSQSQSARWLQHSKWEAYRWPMVNYPECEGSANVIPYDVKMTVEWMRLDYMLNKVKYVL